MNFLTRFVTNARSCPRDRAFCACVLLIVWCAATHKAEASDASLVAAYSFSEGSGAVTRR
jgi:hypothetical protein